MSKPRIRKGLANSYRCAWQNAWGGYWYTFGETMEVAYEKMNARAKQFGASLHEPTTARLDL